MNIEKKIIDFIINNRVSTTEVSDALGKKGVIERLHPINTLSNFHKVGKIKCIFASHESNYLVHEQIENLDKNVIPLICTYKCNDKAIIGDLIAKYILLYKSSPALMVRGKVRDAAKLIKENYPIWSEGFNPLGCYNYFTKPYPLKKSQREEKLFDNSIAVCDTGGAVVIHKKFLNENFLQKLQLIETQEDLWYFCLDTLKWSTKKIVCDKKYLHETDKLSSTHLEKISLLSRSLDKIYKK